MLALHSHYDDNDHDEENLLERVESASQVKRRRVEVIVKDAPLDAVVRAYQIAQTCAVMSRDFELRRRRSRVPGFSLCVFARGKSRRSGGARYLSARASCMTV